mmetsp:Transcript_401/g.1388  ORF Transcript_401/g.1388 Transcript_401/m.1388 type:complete len:269 (+) Transcript_401:1568-2374(+)
MIMSSSSTIGCARSAVSVSMRLRGLAAPASLSPATSSSSRGSCSSSEPSDSCCRSSPAAAASVLSALPSPADEVTSERLMPGCSSGDEERGSLRGDSSGGSLLAFARTDRGLSSARSCVERRAVGSSKRVTGRRRSCTPSAFSSSPSLSLSRMSDGGRGRAIALARTLASWPARTPERDIFLPAWSSITILVEAVRATEGLAAPSSSSFLADNSAPAAPGGRRLWTTRCGRETRAGTGLPRWRCQLSMVSWSTQSSSTVLSSTSMRWK